MPRGQYDRTKSKAARAAAKAGKTVSAKGPRKNAKSSAGVSQDKAGAVGHDPHYGLQTLISFHAVLNQGSGNTALSAKNLVRLDRLAEKIQSSVVETETEDEAAHEAAAQTKPEKAAKNGKASTQMPAPFPTPPAAPQA